VEHPRRGADARLNPSHPANRVRAQIITTGVFIRSRRHRELIRWKTLSRQEHQDPYLYSVDIGEIEETSDLVLLAAWRLPANPFTARQAWHE
jgi:hypothetical protein